MTKHCAIDTDSVFWYLEKTSARKAIPDFIINNDIDLLVMGTVGRTGIPGFLIGNTAETMLSRIQSSP